MQNYTQLIKSNVLAFVISSMFISIKTLHAIDDSNAQQVLLQVDKHFFIENKGQWHSDVLYLARLGGLYAWITKYGVNYTFYKLEEIPSNNAEDEFISDKFKHKEHNLIGHRVLMQLENYNPHLQKEGKQKQEGYYNYFIGNDESKHATNVGLYKEAVVKEVYKGIDIRYYFDRGMLRYDYVVHAGADPSQIKFQIKGSEKTYINSRGNLVFTTCFGEVAMSELFVYQGKDKKNVVASFKKKDNKTWTLAVANYDREQDLIIDPLVYSTYVGGTSADEGYAITIDASGNAYVTGTTYSIDYDITPGVFQTTFGGVSGGLNDVFVTKLNPTGNNLVYSTYLGGINADVGFSIETDGSGNTYITGRTYSNDFDVTTGALQTTYGGGFGDVFVTKLNPTGTTLLYSTYIGGSSDDIGSGIAIDGNGNAYITGYTISNNYDITSGAFQTSNEGDIDVFVTKLNPMGTALVYSTYIGGSGDDYAYDITIDISGNAYIAGKTKSTNFDITTGSFQTTNNGLFDVFVTKLNSTGTALIFSTYLGGSSNDESHGIAVDGNGNIYITGWTNSTNYDITSGAFQTTFNTSGSDVFVTKLNATGTNLVYSTYLGGNGFDHSNDIKVDSNGNAYIVGRSNSNDYSTTSNAFQTTFGGGVYDVFITKFNSTGSGLLYSTYLGGSNDDEGYNIAIDGSGKAYVTGRTTSTNFPITVGSFQTTLAGDKDVFVTKLDIITSIQEITNDGSTFSIYPNPTKNQLNIETRYGGVFELLDIQGRVLQSFTVNNNQETILLNYSTGIYFIREQKSGVVQKVIIE